MPRIIVSVSNDLVTDQRVKKVCQTLYEMGYEILLLGRKFSNSAPIERPYKVHRFSLFFNKKVWFYAELNLRLFFKLLFTKKDILLANDLDTLLPNYLIARLFGKKIVYDSHELFTEVPELTERPKVKKTWLGIEKRIFPKLRNVITVNEVIAKIYEKKYQVPVQVIRNISPKLTPQVVDEKWKNSIKQGRKMLVLQGSGINKDRGAEEAVAMMQYLENMVLFIIGGGDVFDYLKVLVGDLNLQDKVMMLDKLPFDELVQYTRITDLGLSLDKGTNLNYEYSLPNKIFDYIQCQVPLMVSNRKVVAQIIQENNIGVVFENHDPKEMAQIVTQALSDKKQYALWKENLILAADKYTWENESITLKNFYQNLK
jgi:glycosyltransferase involved in cell wall biosynthesis